jgi:hypothetical protein
MNEYITKKKITNIELDVYEQIEVDEMRLLLRNKPGNINTTIIFSTKETILFLFPLLSYRKEFV